MKKKNEYTLIIKKSETESWFSSFKKKYLVVKETMLFTDFGEYLPLYALLCSFLRCSFEDKEFESNIVNLQRFLDPSVFKRTNADQIIEIIDNFIDMENNYFFGA